MLYTNPSGADKGGAGVSDSLCLYKGPHPTKMISDTCGCSESLRWLSGWMRTEWHGLYRATASDFTFFSSSHWREAGRFVDKDLASCTGHGSGSWGFSNESTCWSLGFSHLRRSLRRPSRIAWPPGPWSWRRLPGEPGGMKVVKVGVTKELPPNH